MHSNDHYYIATKVNYQPCTYLMKNSTTLKIKRFKKDKGKPHAISIIFPNRYVSGSEAMLHLEMNKLKW